MSPRKICYVSGTRAEYGLLLKTLRALDASPDIDLSICVTAMHLEARYGDTVQEIRNDGMRICGEVPVDLGVSSHENMVKAIGHEIIGFTDIFMQEKPDIVLLLGDRGESLAAAIVAAHLNIFIAHIHGGDRSGTVDEMVRHSISRFAHFHFAATMQSRERLIHMGEFPGTVFTTGAPGLDGLLDKNFPSRQALCQIENLDPNREIALFIFHPVTQENESLFDQVTVSIKAALSEGLQLLCLTPNADGGGEDIRHALEPFLQHPQVHVHTHFERDTYLAWMHIVDIMLGNSSSGIIESASFNLPVVNIGTRQNLRERSDNILDVPPSQIAIQNAIQVARSQLRYKTFANIYGDGRAYERICQHLETLELDKNLLKKSNRF